MKLLRLLAIPVLLLATITAAPARTLCEVSTGPTPEGLLPQNKDPVQVGLPVSDNVRTILPFFNAGSASERN